MWDLSASWRRDAEQVATVTRPLTSGVPLTPSSNRLYERGDVIHFTDGVSISTSGRAPVRGHSFPSVSRTIVSIAASL
jgi:hypothetical protein